MQEAGESPSQMNGPPGGGYIVAIDRMRVRRALVAATTILVPLTLGTPAAAGAGESQVPGEDPISPAAIGVGEPTIYELISDYSWGYRCGVKQPLGAYKSGLSVHQITENRWPSSVLGNPDHLFWVDEVRQGLEFEGCGMFQFFRQQGSEEASH